MDNQHISVTKPATKCLNEEEKTVALSQEVVEK
jgi:hypothetical protein